MVQEELLSPTRVRHYSDAGFKIRKNETGVVYNDAVDNIPCQYTYTETDEPIDSDSLEISDTEALNIITGQDDE